MFDILLSKQFMADGFNDFKLKVGSDVEDDIRRCSIMRETIGWDRKLMVDANQKWGVQQVGFVLILHLMDKPGYPKTYNRMNNGIATQSAFCIK